MKTFVIGMVPGLILSALVFIWLLKIVPGFNEGLYVTLLVLGFLVFFFTWLCGKLMLLFYKRIQRVP
jgi:hypothetical protein